METFDTPALLQHPAADPGNWLLDPAVTYLNHGAFGACPRVVLEYQQGLRQRLERQPLQFLARDLEPMLDAARNTLAKFVGADPANLVFVPNATTGVNTILRSLDWKSGDEVIVTTQEYNACRNALDFVAQRFELNVIVVHIPFPLSAGDEPIAALLEKVTERTRLVLIDHVTSQTGMVLPVERIVRAMTERGIETLIDGAHAPGMVLLNLKELGATYYTGNCHKWLCAPRSAAFLHVLPHRQAAIRPLTISHGANSLRKDRSRFQVEFAWMGTWDPTAALSVSEALRFMGSLLPGGWVEIRARNRALALAARELLCNALEVAAPCPQEMIGSLASIPLPARFAHEEPVLPVNEHPLQMRLLEKHGIEVPIMPWTSGSRLIRVSAQLYNSLPQYERLADALLSDSAG
ncbi:MAG TPA: aminotransferase class V-fold PLP-dependent enzyme [Verrucomicrobiae bacterium]|nr:aminotransferase class V-fold PLP-dependent enzyme [Verrucomicrobiae bacterium]